MGTPATDGSAAPLLGPVDVHAHYITAQLRNELETAGFGGPESVPAIPDWSPAEALALMDKTGIEVAILSVTSPGVHLGDDGSTRDLARCVNDEGAQVVQAYPGRFGLLASLPLPDLDGALAEWRHALDNLCADGTTLESHYQGRYLGDACYEPLMGELNRRAAVVHLHPTWLECRQATSLGRPRPVIEFPFDATRAVTNLVRCLRPVSA